MTKRAPNKMEISRARQGELQRATSRAALVDAAVRVFESKPPDAAVIGDVILEAGVARGTFYNHFKDVRAVELAVAVKLSNELNHAIRIAYRTIDDPAERVAVAIRHFIRQAANKPNWGWVIVRIAFGGSMGPLMRESIRPDLLAGIARDRFRDINEDVGSDLIMGAGLTAMRSVLEGRAGPGHAEGIAAGVLRGLGLAPAEAATVATRPLPTLP